MFDTLRSLFSSRPQADLPALPAGQRVYAVGDIHGRLDLYAALAAAIDEDDAQGPRAQTTVILLGDLVDRGADSAGVLAHARAWQQRRTVRILCGNHEEMFLKSFDSLDMLRHFLRHGGKQTVLSYGVDPREFAKADLEQAQALMAQAVPAADRAFIEGFEDMIRIGGYVFVHAGIDPQVPLDQQRVSDLRWIREPFLSLAEKHELLVVHGHTISDQPEVTAARIGIDTGAYASGRLTALVLEGTTRRFIEAAADEDGRITITTRAG